MHNSIINLRDQRLAMVCTLYWVRGGREDEKWHQLFFNIGKIDIYEKRTI